MGPGDAHNVAMQQRRAARAGIAVGVVSALLAGAGFWLAWGPGDRSLTGLVHDNTLNNAANGVWISALAIVLLRLRPANRIGWLVLAIALANSVTMFGTGWALASYHVHLPARAFAAWWGAWPWAPGFLLGVQWHPEWQVTRNPFYLGILRAFGDACRAYAARRARACAAALD